METDLFCFIPGYSIANEFDQVAKNPVHVRYGPFENLRAVSGYKQTVLLCRTKNMSKI